MHTARIKLLCLLTTKAASAFLGQRLSESTGTKTRPRA
jgi:hypothetical protein